MLKEAEWMTINNILLELYAQKSIGDLSTKLMRVLRMLIPYTKGYLLLLDADGTIRTDESCFIGMEERESAAYVERYYQEDYLQYLYELSEGTRVYRDTDIIEEERRWRTDFFQKFLLPAGIPYGCGILVLHEGSVLAVFNLFRSKELGDFTDEVMRLLARGLSNSEICDRLTVSISTVKKHIYNLFTKTNVKSRTQLMNLLYQQ